MCLHLNSDLEMMPSEYVLVLLVTTSTFFRTFCCFFSAINVKKPTFSVQFQTFGTPFLWSLTYNFSQFMTLNVHSIAIQLLTVVHLLACTIFHCPSIPFFTSQFLTTGLVVTTYALSGGSSSTQQWHWHGSAVLLQFLHKSVSLLGRNGLKYPLWSENEHGWGGLIKNVHLQTSLVLIQ